MGFKEFLSTLRNKLAPKGQLQIGGYEAAAYTRDRSYIYQTDDDANARKDSYARQATLAKSRYLVNNYAPLERILTLAETYGVGAGIVANAATKDAEFNAAATEAFDSWADNAFCSNNQQYNFYEMQKLIARELVLAGEVFIVLVKTPSNYPQLMLVNSENVRHSGETDDDSINGLYVDAFGKVTAYNIFTGSTFYQKVDASNVIHLMRNKQIGQLRGQPSFVSALNTAHDHKDLVVMEKKAMKIHSALAAVVKKTAGTSGPSGANLFGNIAQIPLNEQTATNSNMAIERIFGSGNVTYLAPNESVDLVASQRGSTGLQHFIEMVLREVCLSISLPYEFVINPDKLNGTAMRFVIQDAAAFFSSLQNVLIDGGLNRIYGWVISSFINNKTLQSPLNTLPWNVSWTKPISLTVDQGRASIADIALMQNSMLTYEAYYSARGKDWRQELAQKAKEEAYLNILAKENDIDINRLRSLAAGAATIATDQQEQTIEDREDKAAA